MRSRPPRSSGPVSCVGEQTWHWRSQDVGGRFRRRGGTQWSHAHDDALPAGRSTVLSREGCPWKRAGGGSTLPSIARASGAARGRRASTRSVGNWIAAAALILGGGRWYTAALGALLATVGHWALVQAAKVDPCLSHVYIRHFRYEQDCYPARASIWAPAPLRIWPTVPTPREMRG